ETTDTSRRRCAAKSPSQRQRLLVAIASLVAVTFLCGDVRIVVVLSLFMGLAGALTMARSLVPERARRAYVLASAAALTLAICLVRKSPALLLFADPSHRREAPAALLAVNFSLLGISYCYLRAIHALCDARAWDARSLFGYYLFAPT